MMSRRKVLACLIVLCGILVFFSLREESLYTELTFSREAGFYEEPFELELYAPRGTAIYYTLDGTEPDENAIRYTEPIFIGYATENENLYSMRTDVTTGSFVEDAAQYIAADALYYTLPDYAVDKCTIVRAAYLDGDGNFSEIKTESYFVGFDDKMGYEGLNIISIVTDPDNLFDYDNGIYIRGRLYDESVKNNLEEPQFNYSQRGYEWERPSTVHFFDVKRGLLFKQECGIRIQGNTSRAYLPKSIKLYAREQYNGESRFYQDLFKTGYAADAITLFAGGQDYVSKMKDMLTAQLVNERNFATMHYVPCAMFLDGEYWGVYWLTEKYDDAFLEYYYGVEKDNIIMVKKGRLAEGRENYYYDEMMQYMYSTDFSIPENYERVGYLVDIQSYIDCYAAGIYIGRCVDWPGTNEALWRADEAGDNEYEDGRWRWMLFDVNTGGLSSDLISTDTLQTVMMNPMFHNLCQNDDFKKQFVISFMDIANTCFTKERVDSIISNYLDLMTEPMNVHMKRFFGINDNIYFLNAVADVQAFFDNRRPYIVQCLKDDFELTGSLVPVEIEINDAGAGSIAVNTAELTFEDELTWCGEYYTDYSITLSATPNEGYHFVGWESGASGQELGNNLFTTGEEKIEVDLPEDGISIRAIFEKTE